MVGRGYPRAMISSNLVICARGLGWEECASGPAPQKGYLTLLRAAVPQPLVLGQMVGAELCLFRTSGKPPLESTCTMTLQPTQASYRLATWLAFHNDKQYITAFYELRILLEFMSSFNPHTHRSQYYYSSHFANYSFAQQIFTEHQSLAETRCLETNRDPSRSRTQVFCPQAISSSPFSTPLS